MNIPGDFAPGAHSAPVAFDPVARRGFVLVDDTSTYPFSHWAGGWAWRRRISGPTAPGQFLGTAWDAPTNRFLRFGRDNTTNYVTAFDPDRDSVWALVGTSTAGPSRRQHCAVATDPVSRRTFFFGGLSSGGLVVSDLYSYSAATGQWTLLSGAGPQRQWSSMIFDPVRQRLVVFGGANATTGQSDTWTFDLAGSSWQGLSTLGTTPPARVGAAAIYDPVRDRMVIQGGNGGLVDAWALTLSNPPTWSRLVDGAQGVAGPSFGFYDPAADEFVLLKEDFSILAFDPAPRLTLDLPSHVTGAPAARVSVPITVTNGLRRDGTGSYHLAGGRTWPGLPRDGSIPLATVSPTTVQVVVEIPDTAAVGPQLLTVVVSDKDGSGAADTATVILDVSAIPLPALACGGDVTWTVGTDAVVDYVVDNLSPAAGPVTYRLTVDRAWPGLPLTGEVNLPALGSALLPLAVPVPDTAAVGAVVARLVVAPKATPKNVVECYRHLHDATTPTLLSVVESQVASDGSHVRLTWWSAAAAYEEITIQRRPDGGAFATIGSAHGDAGGLVVYDDAALPFGGRFAYRAGKPGAAGTEWSPDFWVDVPAAPLAFAGGRALVARGALEVAFTAPDPSPATVEAFDVRGRRFATRRIDVVDRGTNRIRLAANAPSGIYFLRLSQGGRHATGRLILLSGGS
jgi:hypothetical protein